MRSLVWAALATGFLLAGINVVSANDTVRLGGPSAIQGGTDTELVRGRASGAQAALNEVLGITQKLSSGYHRDLQLIKAPLFRGIDSCLQTLEILPSALDGVSFRPENIRLDPGIHAAAAANALVVKETFGDLSSLGS